MLAAGMGLGAGVAGIAAGSGAGVATGTAVVGVTAVVGATVTGADTGSGTAGVDIGGGEYAFSGAVLQAPSKANAPIRQMRDLDMRPPEVLGQSTNDHTYRG